MQNHWINPKSTIFYIFPIDIIIVSLSHSEAISYFCNLQETSFKQTYLLVTYGLDFGGYLYNTFYEDCLFCINLMFKFFWYNLYKTYCISVKVMMIDYIRPV